MCTAERPSRQSGARRRIKFDLVVFFSFPHLLHHPLQSSLFSASTLFFPFHSFNKYNNAFLAPRPHSCCHCSFCPCERLCGYFTLASAILGLISSPKITNPTATSSLPAGQEATIAWQDDNNGSSLATIGPCLVGLYAGSSSQQVCTLSSFLI